MKDGLTDDDLTGHDLSDAERAALRASDITRLYHLGANPYLIRRVFRSRFRICPGLRLGRPGSQTRLAPRVAEPPRPPLRSHCPSLKGRERSRQEDLVLLRQKPIAAAGRRPDALLPRLVP